MIGILAGNTDPLDFRMGLYRASQHPDRDRCHGVAQILKDIERSLGSRLNGLTRGVAIHRSFGTVIGYSVFLKIEGDEIKVKYVAGAVDCGFVVNPDVVLQQVEGGFIFGLSAALKQKITIKNGAVQEKNFHQCDIVRMHECPIFDIRIIASKARPCGIGEPVVAPVAPAVANAVARIPGVGRPYKLPIRLKGGKLI